MSTYYNFYIGYKVQGDDKFHAYGPFNKDKKLYPIYEKSKGFISDIYHQFNKMDINEMDDFLKEKFTYSMDNGDIRTDLHYISYNDLPNDNFMEDGYFPIEDIANYLEEKESDFDEFYYADKISTLSYAKQLETAVKSGNEDEVDRLKGYTYFRYPNFISIGYDSFMIKHNSVDNFSAKWYLENNEENIDEIYILMDIC